MHRDRDHPGTASALLPGADPCLRAVLEDAAARWLGGVEPPDAPTTSAARVLAALREMRNLDGSALRGRVVAALERDHRGAVPAGSGQGTRTLRTPA